MLMRNSRVRDIETVLRISHKTLLNRLVKEMENVELLPQKKHYDLVQYRWVLHHKSPMMIRCV